MSAPALPCTAPTHASMCVAEDLTAARRQLLYLLIHRAHNLRVAAMFNPFGLAWGILL